MVDESRIRELDGAVRLAQQAVEQAHAGLPVFGLEDDLHTEVLVTHGGIVVATDARHAGSPETSWWTSPVDPTVATTMLNVDLSTCASPGDPGGVPLPGGEYSVYLQYDQVTGDRAVAGPWPLTLLTAPPAPTDLPAGFPVDEVPVIGGRLVSA